MRRLLSRASARPGRTEPRATDAPLDEALAGSRPAISMAPWRHSSGRWRSDRAADLRCRLAGLLAESGRPDDARQHLRVALELNPRYLEARLLAARVELESGDAAAAEAQMERALETHAQYPDLWFWLG